jgi:hypothetical protein
MKRINELQILVYIVFTLMVIQNVLPAVYAGFIDGFKNGVGTVNGKNATRLLSDVALDAASFTGTKDTVLQAGKDYSVQNIQVFADVRYNPDLVKTPWWYTVIDVVLVFFTVYLLYRIARNINKIIVSIYKGDMFDGTCRELLQSTGKLLLMYTVADYAFERLSYIEQTYIVLPPLKAISTASFNFGAVLLAIFVFIIAEVFKQGSRLKEETGPNHLNYANYHQP